MVTLFWDHSSSHLKVFHFIVKLFRVSWLNKSGNSFMFGFLGGSCLEVVKNFSLHIYRGSEFVTADPHGTEKVTQGFTSRQIGKLLRFSLVEGISLAVHVAIMRTPHPHTHFLRVTHLYSVKRPILKLLFSPFSSSLDLSRARTLLSKPTEKYLTGWSWHHCVGAWADICK